MFKLTSSINCRIVKDKKELVSAKNNDLCDYIYYEHRASITIWERTLSKWNRFDYHFFNEETINDFETTGFSAYKDFFNYCGRSEVDKMKGAIPNIELWESEEQIHYCNFDYIGQKIYKNIYVYDANSSFTYGVLQLPKEFNKLKEYMLLLYDNKKEAKTKYLRTKYKNKQNFLIGYFARIKDLVSVRSKIIKESNENIYRKMYEIRKAGGIVYISNTDSIITDEVGKTIMDKYLGNDIGQFKLEKVAKKLFYNSSNSYQIGDKLVYSGVGYFAKKHTDMFKEEYARQFGSLLVGKDFLIDKNEEYSKLCRVEYGRITVIVKNKYDEEIKRICYKLGD